jgi:hypothetical protein
VLLTFFNSYIITKEIDDGVIAGDSGEGSFRIGLKNISRIQVAGNYGRFSAENSLVYTQE